MKSIVMQPVAIAIPWVSGAWAGWAAAERGRFVLFLPVCMAAGIAAYFGRRTEPGALQPAILAATALALAVAARARPLPRGLALAAAFAAAGFLVATLATARAPPWSPLPRTATIVAGTVVQAEALPEGRRVTFDHPSLDGGAPLARRVRIRLRDADPAKILPGDHVHVRALLRAPAPPAYPGAWDIQRDAFFADIAGYGFAIGPVAVDHPGPAAFWPGLRAAIAARIRAGLPGAEGAIAATLLTGLGAAIPGDDRAAFQVSGLAHLLAVAGLHIGIVMGLVFGATRTILAAIEHTALHWRVGRIASLAALGAGLFYLELTGAHVPILRSFAMACLVTLALLTGRRALSVRALALAAMVLMVAAPELVMGVSFQMSFAAVLALVAGYELVAPRLALVGAGTWWRAPALYVGGLAMTSALAGTASLPYAAYHFGTATLFYVPANMLAVPITALWVMPWGLATLALMPFGLEQVALVPMGWGVAGLLAIAHAVAAWPGALWPIPQAPPWGLLLVTGGLAWLCLWRTRVRLGGVAALVIGLGSPWLVGQPDIVVSPDARVIALRDGGRVVESLAAGASRFDLETPARVWGMAALPACPAGACRFSLHGAAVALLSDAAADCRGAAVVVAHAPLRGRCTPAMVIDRFSVLDDGATAVTIGPGGVEKRSDRQVRGDRPWVIPSASHITLSTLPPAQAE